MKKLHYLEIGNKHAEEVCIKEKKLFPNLTKDQQKQLMDLAARKGYPIEDMGNKMLKGLVFEVFKVMVNEEGFWPYTLN